MTIEPTDAQVAALAEPGESWAHARPRVRRLLAAVKQCVPCQHCDPEDLARYRFAPGWVDGTTFGTDLCPRCYSDAFDPEPGDPDDCA